jgi:acyl carrier protein
MMGDDAYSINDEDSLLGMGVIDSTGIMEFVDFMEETFHIEVLPEEIVPENLDSISNISSFITSKASASC